MRKSWCTKTLIVPEVPNGHAIPLLKADASPIPGVIQGRLHTKRAGGQNLFAGHYRYHGQIQEFLKEGAVM